MMSCSNLDTTTMGGELVHVQLRSPPKPQSYKTWRGSPLAASTNPPHHQPNQSLNSLNTIYQNAFNKGTRSGESCSVYAQRSDADEYPLAAAAGNANKTSASDASRIQSTQVRRSRSFSSVSSYSSRVGWTGQVRCRHRQELLRLALAVRRCTQRPCRGDPARGRREEQQGRRQGRMIDAEDARCVGRRCGVRYRWKGLDNVVL